MGEIQKKIYNKNAVTEHKSFKVLYLNEKSDKSKAITLTHYLSRDSKIAATK